MSEQLYLVMEDDNVPYEGRSWPIAGFTSQLGAEAWCTQHTADYEHLVAQGQLADAEEAAWPEDLTEEQVDAAYDALLAKYPHARYAGEDRHRFYVHYQALPLNPA